MLCHLAGLTVKFKCTKGALASIDKMRFRFRLTEMNFTAEQCTCDYPFQISRPTVLNAIEWASHFARDKIDSTDAAPVARDNYMNC